MNDQSNMPQLWARQGETVTCTEGHAICDIAHDIHVGEARSGEHFINWRQPEPERSESVGKIQCKVCGARWLNGSVQGGYRFHFADGWR